MDAGKPQVLLNDAPASRGIWRLTPCIDREGRPVTSQFLRVRPLSEDYPLEYLWALLCCPLAHAFAFTHTLKRDILVRVMREMPIPHAQDADIKRVVAAAR